MKINKFLILSFILSIFTGSSFAQQYEDVIILKNKSTLRGTIMQFLMAEQTIKFKTGKEDTVRFKFTEIEKISRSQLPATSGVFVGIGSGYITPTGGDPKNYSGSGFTVYDYQGGLFSQFVGMRVDLQFSSFATKDNQNYKPDSPYMSFAAMFDLLGGNFNAKSRFFYYGLLGIGYNVGQVPKLKAISNDPQFQDITISDSKTVGSFVFHLGGGAGYKLFGCVAFTAELQYNFIGAGSSALSFIPLRFGFSFMPK